MATIRIEHEITKDQLLEIIQETSFSKSEIEQIMHSLLPPRQVRIIGEIKKIGKTKEIGEIFKMGDIQFICNESLDGSCDGCAFATLTECAKFIPYAGHCSAIYRRDNKNVIFRLINVRIKL